MKGLDCVTFIAGRCGSSLTMGLLQKMGYNIGPIADSKSPVNPKGFFEILEWNDEVLKSHSIECFMPEPPKEVKRLDPKKYFDRFPAAIKCPYVFPAPKMCKQIRIVRDIKDQAESIRKMNSMEGDFEGWLERWYDAYPPKGFVIHYEDWKNDPMKNYLKIEDYLNPPKKLTEKEVFEWVNPDYMNIS